MFYLSVWQNQLLLWSLGAGTLLVLGIVLAYLELWRPRREPSIDAAVDRSGETVVEWFFSHVSWVLVLIAASVGLWGLLYAIDKIMNPPNW